MIDETAQCQVSGRNAVGEVRRCSLTLDHDGSHSPPWLDFVGSPPSVPAPTPDGQTGAQGRRPATIASIVRALEATYTDEGVDIWLTSENALTGGIPLHRLGRATGRDLVAAAVASVDGCDPCDPEFSS